MIRDRLAAGTIAFGKSGSRPAQVSPWSCASADYPATYAVIPHFSNTGAAMGNETTGDIRFFAYPWRTLLVSYSSAKRSIQAGCTSST